MCCASIAGALLALPLVLAAPGTAKLSEGVIQLKTCYQVTQLPHEIHDLIAGRPVEEAGLCEFRPNLVFPLQRLVTIKVVEPTQEGSRIKRFTEYEFSVDDEGVITQSVEIDSVLAQFILLIGSALFVTRTGTTPGKRLLNLRVTGEGCVLCREARRIGPFLVFAFAELGLTFYAQTLTELYSISWMLVVSCFAVLLAAFVGYYIVPMIRWSGAMPYDRATGFRVTRR